MKSPYYINVNGCYGQGPYARPDYASLQEFLDSMDRLGIGQAVVFHTLARDLHPVYGNRYLMADIAATPGAAERVIPALAVNPSMLAGIGEMESVISYLRNQEAGCIALFPVTNRYRLLEIRPILDMVRAYRPLFLIDVTEMTSEDMEDLAAIAEDYPELYFVVRQIMWWQFSRIFNLLGRVKNIIADISWLHTRDSIRILRDQAGPGRLVFGAGYRAHGGAAISALSWANIPQYEKDHIASDTLISLLPAGPVRDRAMAGRRTVENKIGNRFWNDFLNEKPLTDVLVIDAHTHIGPFARSWFLRDNSLDGQLAALDYDRQRFGIDRFVSQPETALFGQAVEGNRMVEQAFRDYAGKLAEMFASAADSPGAAPGSEAAGKTSCETPCRPAGLRASEEYARRFLQKMPSEEQIHAELMKHFRGNLFFNAIYSDLYTEELLDELFAGGYFCGFKILPDYLDVDVADPGFIPCFRYADKHHMHILIHTWEGKCGTALQCAEVAKHYPNASFIFGHTGGGTEGRHQCEKIAQDPQYANCYFEFCGSFTTPVRWEDSLEKIDYHRVVYGTDTIVHDIAWELGRLLSLDIPEEQIEVILGANMEKILARRQ